MNHLGCTQRKCECALNLRKASRSISGHGTSASLDSQLGWNCCQHLLLLSSAAFPYPTGLVHISAWDAPCWGTELYPCSHSLVV